MILVDILCGLAIALTVIVVFVVYTVYTELQHLGEISDDWED